MSMDEINEELKSYKVNPLSKKEFKYLYKKGYYKYDNKYLMDPDSLMKLISQRIHPVDTKITIQKKKFKSGKNFNEIIYELLKQLEMQK